MRSLATFLLLAAAAHLGGCATSIFNRATNEPLTAATPPDMGAPSDVMRENSIVLSLSGGGLRAAAFSHGVLTALTTAKTPEGDLLDDVALISSVSGSSITAAYYGLNGRAGLPRFRDEVLVPGFESGMRLSLLNPANLLRMLGGGLNARENFGDVLDRKVFHGATFADLYRSSPAGIRIHSTDLYHRVPFPFLPPLFLVLCSDLSRYSVADAVAASMAVPMLFAPVVIRTFPEHCRPLPPEVARIKERIDSTLTLNAIARATDGYREPRVRYIKLADGGLTDNFAVSTLTLSRIVYGTPYAPMSERDAVRIRRLLVIVVDASRGPSGDWVDREAGPTGMDLALSGTDAAVDSAARLAADAFGQMIEQWQNSVITFRCGLEPADVARLGGPADWSCRDVKFTLAHLSVHGLESPHKERIDAIPTRLTLSLDQVDATIDGARAGTLALPQLRAYMRDRVKGGP
jgi:NTE family protein